MVPDDSTRRIHDAVLDGTLIDALMFGGDEPTSGSGPTPQERRGHTLQLPVPIAAVLGTIVVLALIAALAMVREARMAMLYAEARADLAEVQMGEAIRESEQSFARIRELEDFQARVVETELARQENDAEILEHVTFAMANQQWLAGRMDALYVGEELLAGTISDDEFVRRYVAAVRAWIESERAAFKELADEPE